MGWLARYNKFLIVQAAVELTEIIDPVIVVLDKYFEQANHKALVTRGFSTAEQQLDLIRQYLVAKGLAGKYAPAMNCNLNEMIDGTYVWQMAWSNLLNIGVTINPPVPARVLMNYTKDGINMIGTEIPGSSHVNGKAFNIGGIGNDMNGEAAIVQRALNDGVPGLIDFYIAGEHNIVHCECDAV